MPTRTTADHLMELLDLYRPIQAGREVCTENDLNFDRKNVVEVAPGFLSVTPIAGNGGLVGWTGSRATTSTANTPVAICDAISFHILMQMNIDVEWSPSE